MFGRERGKVYDDEKPLIDWVYEEDRSAFMGAIRGTTEFGKITQCRLRRWSEDGRLLWDNNLAENVIRPITLGRKNYLFCGNHEAAANMSVICSLLATCKAHDVNPREYLNDVIARMPYHKKATHEELLELLPHKWKLQHPESALTKQEEEAGNRC